MPGCIRAYFVYVSLTGFYGTYNPHSSSSREYIHKMFSNRAIRFVIISRRKIKCVKIIKYNNIPYVIQLSVLICKMSTEDDEMRSLPPILMQKVNRNFGPCLYYGKRSTVSKIAVNSDRDPRTSGSRLYMCVGRASKQPNMPYSTTLEHVWGVGNGISYITTGRTQ